MPRRTTSSLSRRIAAARATVSVGLLAAILVGCSDSEGPPPTLVRLFDDAKFVSCEGPIDMSSRARMLETTATALIDDDSTSISADQSSKFEQPADLPVVRATRPGNINVSDWDGTKRLRIISPGLYLRRLDLPAGTPILLQVDLLLREKTSLKVFAAERSEFASAAELRTKKLVRHIMEFELERTHFLRPETITDDGRTRFSAIINVAPGTKSVVFGLFAEQGSCAITRIQASELAPLAQAVLGTVEVQYPPFRRSITRGRDQHESLIVPTDGALRLSCRIPAGDPKLTFGLIGIDADEAPSYSVQVRATSDDDDTKQVHKAFALQADPQLNRSFQDFELDLSALASESATVEISATSEVAGAPGIAMGSPAIAPASRDADNQAPLDLVIVSLDTVRADRLGLYGADPDPAPVLTELAESSVVFENAIAASSWTLPSHVTIFTGQLPERHRVETEYTRILYGRAPLLAPELRRMGYRTYASTGGGFVTPKFGFAEGFERFGSVDPAFPPLEWAEAAAPKQIPIAERSIRERERLLAYLRDNPNGPRFCFAHTYVAHNYQIPPSILRELGMSEEDIERVLPGMNLSELGKLVNQGNDTEAIEQAAADLNLLYYAGLMLADQFLGDVIEAIRESGRLDRTLLVVLSDHGEELLDHGKFGHKNSVYEELIRVPLLIRIPGQDAGRISNVVSLADLAPTIRELLGIDPPRQPMDGKSLIPVIGGARWEEPAFASTIRLDGRYLRAIRGQDMKLIQVENRKRKQSEFSLYQLDRDPKEARDMAHFLKMDTEKLKKVMGRHSAKLKNAAAASQDTTLSAETIRELKELGYLGGE